MTTVCNDGNCSYGKEREKIICLVRTGLVTGQNESLKTQVRYKVNGRSREELDLIDIGEEYLLLAVAEKINK